MKHLDTAYIEFRSPDILYVKFKDVGTELTDEQYFELLEEAKSLMGRKKHFLLLDARDAYFSLSHRARQAKVGNPYLKEFRVGEAFLINSLPMKLVANVFLSINKPSTPTKVFTKEEDAMAWFETLRNKKNGQQPNGNSSSFTALQL